MSDHREPPPSPGDHVRRPGVGIGWGRRRALGQISGYETGHVGLKGIIAIAVIFGGWTLRGTIIGCLLFGCSSSPCSRLSRARPPHQRPAGRQPSLSRSAGDHGRCSPRGAASPADWPNPSLRGLPPDPRGCPCLTVYNVRARRRVCPSPDRTGGGVWVARCTCPRTEPSALSTRARGQNSAACGSSQPASVGLTLWAGATIRSIASWTPSGRVQAACQVGSEDQLVELVERARAMAVIVGSSRTKASASCFSVSPASMAT